MDEQQITSMFARALSSHVLSITRIGSGRNSQVYRLDCPDGACFAGKRYFNDPADLRDRMGTEVTSLRFMADHGITCVPSVIAVDPDRHCAVYQYVDGRELPGKEVSPAHVDKLIRFLLQLQQLRHVPLAAKLPLASDACLSLADALQNIQERLTYLRALPNQGQTNLDLHTFLSKEFTPLFEKVAHFCTRLVENLAIDTQIPLPRRQCVLSPSDFGFHNALEQPDGKMTFLDFEYFGWDDPAKMLSDFLLHPAVEIGHELKQQFLDGMFSTPGSDAQLIERLKATYPLCGLKWCMILLNEFIPASLQRRNFSANDTPDRDTTCTAQLAKARTMLQKIEREYKCFPYSLARSI